jgi:hypothetical protein
MELVMVMVMVRVMVIVVVVIVIVVRSQRQCASQRGWQCCISRLLVQIKNSC